MEYFVPYNISNSFNNLAVSTSFNFFAIFTNSGLSFRLAFLIKYFLIFLYSATSTRFHAKLRKIREVFVFKAFSISLAPVFPILLLPRSRSVIVLLALSISAIVIAPTSLILLSDK